jgi:hypothetical protein
VVTASKTRHECCPITGQKLISAADRWRSSNDLEFSQGEPGGMSRADFRIRALATIEIAALAFLGASESSAQTTYGEDPIPNSQFWNGELSQGYGFDRVPRSATNESPDQPVYGVDQVPDSRYYKRSLDVTPRSFDPREQMLTRSGDNGPRTTRPSRARPRTRAGR